MAEQPPWEVALRIFWRPGWSLDTTPRWSEDWVFRSQLLAFHFGNLFSALRAVLLVLWDCFTFRVWTVIFWLYVLIKKTHVTCYKYKKNASNVPGKLSAGACPCLGPPYNFSYSSPTKMSSGLISDAEWLQRFSQADWLCVGNGWSHWCGWLTDVIKLFRDGVWGAPGLGFYSCGQEIRFITTYQGFITLLQTWSQWSLLNTEVYSKAKKLDEYESRGRRKLAFIFKCVFRTGFFLIKLHSNLIFLMLFEPINSNF